MTFFPPDQIRLRGSATLGAPKNQYVYQEVNNNHIFSHLCIHLDVIITVLNSQACLPIYVSALKRAFSLAMGIKFGSGVFWVSPAPTAPSHCITIQALVYNFIYLFFPGGSAGDELKADGADEAQTGIHRPAPVQPLRPRCLLVITE